ncbi:fumarylacetoacetate hydrolase family protein [Bradyrhizobium tropiciagri]|uniref:fumarylacetoacetate hydrolase family protein n=1 Tax=Bradyrhizobium tropiciagri TaxID=312253 RepID=UPI001BA53A9A|nr:fumarylacetoacetate hydrolase family protein [Bradyrhizobium tropiciagri]MBR0874144.1 fumarylacetoacetate hydrolase family protein [Bradyrhizobium tropiciagri]
MRICRFNQDRLGVVTGDEVVDVSAALAALPQLSWPLAPGDHLIRNFAGLRSAIEQAMATGQRHALSRVQLLSPIANASKVIAAPVNYALHLAEARADAGVNFGSDIKTIDHYGLFLKSSTSVVGAGDGIVLPDLERRIDHEVEVVAVIGRECADVSEREALDYVFGYCIGLDMSVRGTEDRSWRKSYDSFTVLGPYLVTADEIDDPGNLDLSLDVNGVQRQSSNTRALIFSIPKLIAYASAGYRLYPGDVIMTGTPEGVGPVVDGDLVTSSVTGLGTMQVKVVSARKRSAA